MILNDPKRADLKYQSNRYARNGLKNKYIIF